MTGQAFTTDQKRALYAFIFGPMVVPGVLLTTAILFTMLLLPPIWGQFFASMALLMLIWQYAGFLVIGIPVHLVLVKTGRTKLRSYLISVSYVVAIATLIWSLGILTRHFPSFGFGFNIVLIIGVYLVAVGSTLAAYMIRWPERLNLQNQ